MSDTIDVSSTLLKMATSSDAAVRQSAVLYKQLLVQKERLEGLIAFYGQALAELENAPKIKIKPAAQVAARNGPTTHEVKEFVDRLVVILEECGKETSFNDLYTLYYQRFPNDAKLPTTTFRQRVTKKTKVFCSVNRKYWLTGREVPSPNGLDHASA